MQRFPILLRYHSSSMLVVGSWMVGGALFLWWFWVNGVMVPDQRKQGLGFNYHPGLSSGAGNPGLSLRLPPAQLGLKSNSPSTHRGQRHLKAAQFNWDWAVLRKQFLRAAQKLRKLADSIPEVKWWKGSKRIK